MGGKEDFCLMAEVLKTLATEVILCDFLFLTLSLLSLLLILLFLQPPAGAGLVLAFFKFLPPPPPLYKLRKSPKLIRSLRLL